TNLTVPYQQHEGHAGRQRFGERRQIEDRSLGHRRGVGLARAPAERAQIEHAIGFADQQYGTGKNPAAYGGVERVFDRGETWRHAHRFDDTRAVVIIASAALRATSAALPP